MKRYQIFISSTYNDLIEERRSVVENILKLRHIPVGMEQFVATNQEQFEYIKQLIDNTDYYVLIVGNRYGSIAFDGIGYTEKEYDYAVKKEIPILAFIHSAPNALSIDKSDGDAVLSKKLEEFREKVSKGRLVSFFSWNGPDSLSAEVAVALTNAIQDFPRPGWERYSEILEQINGLRAKNDNLKEQIKTMPSLEKEKQIIDFTLNDTIEIIGISNRIGFEDVTIPITISWRQVLSVVGHLVLSKTSLLSFKYDISEMFFGKIEPMYYISDKDIKYILYSFQKSHIMEVSNDEVFFTTEGKNFLYNNDEDIDELLKDTNRLKNSIKPVVTIKKTDIEKYIQQLSNSNSNPETINHIEKTLIDFHTYLSN